MKQILHYRSRELRKPRSQREVQGARQRLVALRVVQAMTMLRVHSFGGNYVSSHFVLLFHAAIPGNIKS